MSHVVGRREKPAQFLLFRLLLLECFGIFQCWDCAHGASNIPHTSKKALKTVEHNSNIWSLRSSKNNKNIGRAGWNTTGGLISRVGEMQGAIPSFENRHLCWVRNTCPKLHWQYQEGLHNRSLDIQLKRGWLSCWLLHSTWWILPKVFTENTFCYCVWQGLTPWDPLHWTCWKYSFK